MNSQSGKPADGERQSVTRAAGIIGVATLISRVFGYVRDMVFASFFGAGMAADAFIAAFRIPNLLRRLFGEGSLSIAFVPVFTQTLVKHGRENAMGLAVSSLKLLLICLLVVSVIGIVTAPLVVHLVAPGFSQTPEKIELTVTLTRIMFPYVIFVGLVALCMGILNVLGHFAAPALAPVLLNLAMIGAVFSVSLVSDSETIRILGLACGVLLGGVLQLFLQLPFLIRHGVRFYQSSGLWHPAMKQVGALMLPVIFGSAVYQINILIGTLLASFLPGGSVSYLYYADRLVQFPLGIFGQALATAVLPSLSRQAAADDHSGMGETFGHAMSLVLFITIPAMVGLIVLRQPIVALLFERGAFDSQTTRLTSDALLYYSIGLWAFSAVRIVVSTFYAMQDTRTPVVTATIAIVANILFGLLLMGPMAHCGLALATSLASMVNLGLLVFMLRRKMGTIRWRLIAVSFMKTLTASAIMAAVVVAITQLIIPSDSNWELMHLSFGIGGGVIGGIAVFFIAAHMLKIREWQVVAKMIKKGLVRS